MRCNGDRTSDWALTAVQVEARKPGCEQRAVRGSGELAS